MPVLISDMTRKMLRVLLLPFVIVGLGMALGQQSKDSAVNNGAQAKPSAEGAVVEYQQPQPEPPALGTEDQNRRRIKDRRYDGHQVRPIDDAPGGPQIGRAHV